MFKLLKNYSTKNWLYTVLILLLTIGQVFFTMQIVELVAHLQTAIQVKNINDVWKNGLFMLLFAVALAVVQVIIQFLASYTASDFATKTRKSLYKKANAFATADMATFSTESLITRTTNDIQNIHLALLTSLRTIFVAPITIIWSIIKLVKNANSTLTITTAIWIIVLVVTVIALVLVIMPKYKIVQRLTDSLNVASRENLTGVRVVRAFNAEGYQQDKFTKINNQYTKAQIFTGKAISLFSPVIIFVMTGLSFSITWISAYLINGKDVAAASALLSTTNSFIMLASQIVMSFVLLVMVIILLPRANVCAKRVCEILYHDESIKDTSSPVEFTEKGTIEFNDVGFMYPGASKEAVSHISFKVKQGETLAIIGATGSGKTTIINMIPRLADATSGEVKVNGVNVKDVLQADLRNIIGYTPQRAFLFKGNVRENISFSNPEMSDEDVIEASKIAEAHEFISHKRKEYLSEVAQGGTNFSGGQKQRLCIARSVAKKPQILIFDDSFSALDYKTDKVVRSNIKNSLPQTTRVIIAQRVGTIMDADQILVLDKGQIVGQGTHKDLVRNCPVYQEIALSQLSKEELGL